MDTLIITGGSIEEAFAASYIQAHRFDRVIAADRGLNFCERADLVPDLILGDFDSADGDVFCRFREKFPERIRQYPAQKDETDTELALTEALLSGSSRITILGGTGTRLDHVLGNIHLLKRALEADVPCFLTDGHNRIRMVRGGCILKKREQFGKYVSLLPFTERVEIRELRGFAYNVSDLVLELGMPVGVSNEIADDEAVISLGGGILLVIESKD